MANFFDNLNLAPGAVMQDFNYQWTSLIVGGFPFIRGDNQTRPPRPSEPNVDVGLPAWYPASVATRTDKSRCAGGSGQNGLHRDPDPAGPGIHTPGRWQGLFPTQTSLSARRGSSRPSSSEPMRSRAGLNPHNPETAGNNWLDYDKPKPLSWWAKYSSQPSNMGPYTIQGVRESVAEFLQSTSDGSASGS